MNFLSELFGDIICFPINLFFGSPLAFALLFSVPLALWLRTSIRKKRRFELILSIILLLLVWYTPALQASAYVTFGLHTMAQPEGRDVLRVRYEWDSKRGATDIYAVYTDEPSTQYHYDKNRIFGGLYDWPVYIEPDRETYPVGVTEISGKVTLSPRCKRDNENGGRGYKGNTEFYILQRFDGESWQRYGLENVGFHELLGGFDDGDKITFPLGITYTDEKGLPEGRYRIVKPLELYKIEESEKRGEEVSAYCYFEVK